MCVGGWVRACVSVYVFVCAFVCVRAGACVHSLVYMNVSARARACVCLCASKLSTIAHSRVLHDGVLKPDLSKDSTPVLWRRLGVSIPASDLYKT